MIVRELLSLLEKYAKEYRVMAVQSINRNDHMNKLRGLCKLSQDEVDALLVDFVNYVGVKQYVDYGLNTKHLG